MFLMGCKLWQTSVSLHQQQLQFNGKEMKNSDRLSSIGVGDGDMVMMVPVASGSGYLSASVI